MKSYFLLFAMIGELGTPKNYRSIRLTGVDSKVYVIPTPVVLVKYL